MFGVSRGKIKPPKQILFSYAVETLKNNVELNQMLNRCSHGIAYSQLEEINTALRLQRMASTSEIPLPNNIQPHVSTTLAWDNIEQLEETLPGEGTSHSVNGIVVQARNFGPQLLSEPSTQRVKTKKRSVEHWMQKIVSFTMQESAPVPLLEYLLKVPAKKTHFIWVLVRLHADTSRKLVGGLVSTFWCTLKLKFIKTVWGIFPQ